MSFHENKQVRYFTFQSFDEAGVIAASLTRKGGVSPKPWAALNVGGTVGDDPARVLENRLRSFKALDLSFDSLYDVWQVHSDRIVFADAPRPGGQAHLQADAILTDSPGVTLFMRFADCAPIFLYDPVHRAAGLVHAGWKGTVLKIAELAVKAMLQKYGSNPADILAGIGPSIAAHHYQVGPEVIERVQLAFGAVSNRILYPDPEANGRGLQLDLWSANRLILEQVGVQQIEIAGICTACQLKDWYSHRGENGKTGRFGALMAI